MLQFYSLFGQRRKYDESLETANSPYFNDDLLNRNKHRKNRNRVINEEERQADVQKLKKERKRKKRRREMNSK